MSKQLFIEKKFSASSVVIIDLVNDILEEYRQGGYDLSLRQLYYQLVARGYIENSVKSYKRVGDIVSDARLAGMVDWEMIKDRGRVTVTPPHWSSPKSILRACANSFAIDKWEDQRDYLEVMVEKQALEGVLIPICQSLDIRFIANKGYSSSSTMHEIGQRLRDRVDENKNVTIFYLGDHDPSGLDMTRDVRERLNLFAETDCIEVERLALNMDQVEDLQPPENPAKETDSRFKSYQEEFGDSSWELDAIEPTQLAAIVENAVDMYRDEDAWSAAVEKENKYRADLEKMAANYRDQ